MFAALLVPLRIIAYILVRLFAPGGAVLTILAYIFYMTVFKVLGLLGIGFGTYYISSHALDFGLEKIQGYIDSLFLQNDYIDPLILTDFIHTMKFIEALSIIFSAVTISISISTARHVFTSTSN